MKMAWKDAVPPDTREAAGTFGERLVLESAG
jgi:hypothetical protein